MVHVGSQNPKPSGFKRRMGLMVVGNGWTAWTRPGGPLLIVMHSEKTVDWIRNNHWSDHWFGLTMNIKQGPSYDLLQPGAWTLYLLQECNLKRLTLYTHGNGVLYNSSEQKPASIRKSPTNWSGVLLRVRTAIGFFRSWVWLTLRGIIYVTSLCTSFWCSCLFPSPFPGKHCASPSWLVSASRSQVQSKLKNSW